MTFRVVLLIPHTSCVPIAPTMLRDGLICVTIIVHICFGNLVEPVTRLNQSAVRARSIQRICLVCVSGEAICMLLWKAGAVSEVIDDDPDCDSALSHYRPGTALFLELGLQEAVLMYSNVGCCWMP